MDPTKKKKIRLEFKCAIGLGIVVLMLLAAQFIFVLLPSYDLVGKADENVVVVIDEAARLQKLGNVLFYAEISIVLAAFSLVVLGIINRGKELARKS